MSYYLFKKQSNKIAHKTAISFLHSVSQLFFENENEHEQLLNKLYGRKFENGVNYGELCAELFLNLLSDDIRIHQGDLPLWYDEASVYYRSDGYKSTLFKNIAKTIGVTITDTDYVLIANLNYLKFYYPNHQIYTLSIQIGLVVLKDKSEVRNPVSSVDRAVLIETSINAGINPFDIYKCPEVNRNGKYKKTFKVPGWSHKNMSDESEILKHWEKIVKESNALYSKTMTFNSGAMANECVIYGVKSLQLNSAHIQSNWYYENVDSINSTYTVQSDLSQSRVLFAGLEPTNYINFEDETREINVEQAINSFLNVCSSKPKDQFVMVLDCTVNPKFELTKTLPDNLLVLKTLSVTKHQNGDRRQFFGLCIVAGNVQETIETVYNSITKYKHVLGASLSGYALKSFPKPSKTSLVHKMTTCLNINKHVALFCNKTGNEDWVIKPYTYTTFISMPKDTKTKILDAVENLPQKELTAKSETWNKQLERLIVNYTLAPKFNRNFEFGDSFGLNISRINIQGERYTFTNGKQARIKIPRICFGYETDVESAKLFTRGLLEILKAHSF